MVRVEVNPALFRWARERARLGVSELTRAFPKLPEWERGEARPTLKQLENYARRTHAPIGYFFLSQPPEEPVPIPDFRTIRNQAIARPSADLLDTVYICQMRQDWFREYAIAEDLEPVSHVGALQWGSDVLAAAGRMREALGASTDARRRLPNWEAALRYLIDRVESAGVLVMRNGVVGNNTHRKLDRDEFRGFALSDDRAPLVFVNAADSKSAQMFTLAHELVHIFVGQTALSDASVQTVNGEELERWCNEVAAEFLVPMAEFREVYRPDVEWFDEMKRLATRFKVSTLVALRRMYDAGGMSREEFWERFALERDRLADLAPAGGGGDFHATEAVRVSPRFARALITSTLEGHTLYTEAFHLLGISKTKTFETFGESLGVLV